MNDNQKNCVPYISAELIPTSFILISLEPRPEITYLNRKALSLFKAKNLSEFYSVCKNDGLNLIYKEDLPTVIYTVNKGLKKGVDSLSVEIRICALDGTCPFVRAQIIPVYENGGKCRTLYAALFDDTKNHNLISKYLRESSCDALTGLLNREGLMREFKNTFQDGFSDFFVIILDIDNFKEENDTSGHSFGDIILKSSAELIKSCFGKGSIVSRYGGDEFVIITRASEPDLKNSLSALLKRITEIGKSAENGVLLSASAGISKNGADGASLEILLKNADKALYYSKSHGKNRFTFYGDIKSTGENAYKNDLMRGTRLTPKDLINTEKSRKLINLLDSVFLNKRQSSENIRLILMALTKIYGCGSAYIYKLSEDKIPERRLYSWPTDTLSPYEKIRFRDELLKKTYVRCASRFTPEGLYICENLSFLSESEYDFLEKIGIKSFMWIIFKTSPDKDFSMLGLDFAESPIKLSSEDFITILVLSKIIGHNLGAGELSGAPLPPFHN